MPIGNDYVRMLLQLLGHRPGDAALQRLALDAANSTLTGTSRAATLNMMINVIDPDPQIARELATDEHHMVRCHIWMADLWTAADLAAMLRTETHCRVIAAGLMNPVAPADAVEDATADMDDELARDLITFADRVAPRAVAKACAFVAEHGTLTEDERPQFLHALDRPGAARAVLDIDDAPLWATLAACGSWSVTDSDVHEALDGIGAEKACEPIGFADHHMCAEHLMRRIAERVDLAPQTAGVLATLHVRSGTPTQPWVWGMLKPDPDPYQRGNAKARRVLGDDDPKLDLARLWRALPENERFGASGLILADPRADLEVLEMIEPYLVAPVEELTATALPKLTRWMVHRPAVFWRVMRYLSTSEVESHLAELSAEVRSDLAHAWCRQYRPGMWELPQAELVVAGVTLADDLLETLPISLLRLLLPTDAGADAARVLARQVHALCTPDARVAGLRAAAAAAVLEDPEVTADAVCAAVIGAAG